MRVAIFGGSFDPIHIAHVAIVKEALKTLDIDKIIVVPTYLNPFKKEFYFEPNIRLELIKKVFKNNPKVNICDYEIKQNRAVFTYETVNYIKKQYNPSKFFIIIGEDNISSLNKWYKIEELKELAQFVVATRNSHKNDDIKNFKTLDINIEISSTSIRNKLDLEFIPIEIKDEIKKLHKGKN